ncbi:hypothetical protein G5714_016406 [Onychostoma macrolepis]|uniref:Uncharacterized protein n=1 Tax=Onychostoma macrolepis TaxID=369639 RepID=A0A7J6CA38_9TELE|nr:hypothetical protein G5714_016406 [Onychostoma macrolepis]
MMATSHTFSRSSQNFAVFPVIAMTTVHRSRSYIAVGWRPLLLLEYPHKKAKLILPKDLALGTNAQTCMKNIHKIFKIMVEGNTNQATESSQEPEEATVILHLETLVNPSTAEQDSTATACLDQGAGTMDGPELNLHPPPTGQGV